VREEQLATIRGKDRLDYECRVHIERCRLLSQLGRLQNADLDAAREAARRLRYPDEYVAEINKLVRDS
jgi:hypothetical protein